MVDSVQIKEGVEKHGGLRKGGKKKKRDDLWALGETEPRGYPSLSGREVREREKRGLDGRVRGAEGEGPNGPPNHILHLGVILGVYILSAMQMWGGESRYSPLRTLQELCGSGERRHGKYLFQLEAGLIVDVHLQGT